MKNIAGLTRTEGISRQEAEDNVYFDYNEIRLHHKYKVRTQKRMNLTVRFSNSLDQHLWIHIQPQ